MASEKSRERKPNPLLKGNLRQAERMVDEQVAAACRLSAVPGGSGHFATPAESLAAVGHLRL